MTISTPMTMYDLIEIIPAPLTNKHKMIAIFRNRQTGRIKKTPFGIKGYEDYTIHKDKERRSRYRKRHEKDLKTNDPTRAGYLSYYILWGETTNVKKNYQLYKKRFFISPSSSPSFLQKKKKKEYDEEEGKVKRRDEALWQKVKRDVCPTTWSARCAQLSVNEYKRRYFEKLRNDLCEKNMIHTEQCKKKTLTKFHQENEGYYGPKPSSQTNRLRKWTQQDWGYINDDDDDENDDHHYHHNVVQIKKEKYGRYLPRKVRNLMSTQLKKDENERKGNALGKRIPYSDQLKTLMKSVHIF